MAFIGKRGMEVAPNIRRCTPVQNYLFHQCRLVSNCIWVNGLLPLCWQRCGCFCELQGGENTAKVTWSCSDKCTTRVSLTTLPNLCPTIVACSMGGKKLWWCQGCYIVAWEWDMRNAWSENEMSRVLVAWEWDMRNAWSENEMSRVLYSGLGMRHQGYYIVAWEWDMGNGWSENKMSRVLAAWEWGIRALAAWEWDIKGASGC